MGRILSGLVVVLALSASAAACASGDDDDNVLSDFTEDESKQDDGKDDDKGNDDDPKRGEYVEALATAAQTPDPDDPSEDFQLSEEAATCLAEGLIDVVGLDRLEAAVSPDEILADPSADLVDMGIDLSNDQGAEVFHRLVDCEPAAMRQLAESISSEVTGDDDFPIDVDVECLANADPGDIDDFMGASLAQGDDLEPTKEQARSMFDWLGECADLEASFLEALGDVPPSIKQCAADKIDEDDIKDLMVAGAMAGDDADFDELPEGRAFTEALNACAGR